MFEFKITLSDDDYLLFNQYHLLNSLSGKKYLMSIKFVCPLICFMFIVILYIAGSDFKLILSETIFMTIISIFWIIFSKRKILKSMNKRITKMKKEGRLPYSNQAILKFDDEKIHEITPNTENVTKYSLIEKIAVTEKAIYIYFSSLQAFILPVTAFSKEIERLEFLEFINKKVDILKDTRQS
ncbi:YcxB family protein [Lacrimispora sp.]|uniref:YcxB family protein n=1 Tax=Lacrimispora sp. TaxID=2719234 RepID=UPI0028AECC04|nr:YcxB family protein [Lacrimispora sp.]